MFGACILRLGSFALRHLGEGKSIFIRRETDDSFGLAYAQAYLIKPTELTMVIDYYNEANSGAGQIGVALKKTPVCRFVKCNECSRFLRDAR